MTRPCGGHSLAHITFLHIHNHVTSCLLSFPCHLSGGCMDSTCFPCLVWPTTSLYGLPCVTFPLVHRLIEKVQKWVTHGNLWCFHVIMLMSSWHMSSSACAMYHVWTLTSSVLMLASTIRMLTHHYWLG
jgi:hypothetical protein